MSSNFLCDVNEWTVLAINKKLMYKVKMLAVPGDFFTVKIKWIEC